MKKISILLLVLASIMLFSCDKGKEDDPYYDKAVEKYFLSHKWVADDNPEWTISFEKGTGEYAGKVLMIQGTFTYPLIVSCFYKEEGKYIANAAFLDFIIDPTTGKGQRGNPPTYFSLIK